ncbi:hypothetical protein PoB_001021400 [Plakobranchus ocellatus]|uniref:Uncharacterized protein n=1 Tax=Plakobranchus ocellatus TaxID=259542 RepID=A0AAV3YNV3_9GAST|nr:hypothetical protein PoB_001021400 [Plakobranchus ocellatus]
MTALPVNVTTTTESGRSYESTLLIPENVVWLPYVGLVVVVLVGLGFDFFKFHQKNRVKYACIKEHASIASYSPKRQRICMISGVALRFKKGKPVLGEVWNTSPSSSEVSRSSYSPWREGLNTRTGQSDGDGCYSREITPSDDGGAIYPERDNKLTKRDNNSSFKSLINSDSEDEAYREPSGWSLGGEIIAGPTREKAGDESLNSYGFSLYGSEIENQTPVKGQSNEGKGHGQRSNVGQKHIVTTATVEPNTLVSSGHNGNPTSQRNLQDASTQTDPVEVSYNIDLSHGQSPRFVQPIRPGSGQRRNVLDPNRTSAYHHLGEPPDYNDIPPSPRPHSPYHYSHGVPGSSNAAGGYGSLPQKYMRRMTTGGAGLSPPEPQSIVIDFSPRSMSGDRARDGHSNPATPRQPRSKFDQRRKQDLALDILTSPRSPTTEIVAKDHGFELAGVEVPYVAGVPSMSSGQQGGGNSGTGTSGGGGGTMFKAPGMQVQGKSFIRPVMSSSATSSPLNTGGFKYKTESSSALCEAVELGSGPLQRPNYRRVHSLSMEMDENHSHHPSSARSLPAAPATVAKPAGKKGSHGHGQNRAPHSARTASSSPRSRKDRPSGSRSRVGIGGGVDDGGGGGGGGAGAGGERNQTGKDREGSHTIEEEGGGWGRKREDESGKVRDTSSSKSTPTKTLSVPGFFEQPEQEQARLTQHNSVKHPQLKQREAKELRQQQYQYHHERHDSNKRKLSSQSFSAGSGRGRRRSERSGSGGGGAGGSASLSGSGEKGSKSAPASASIPSHLYHEDEEGYFSSHAAASHAALSRAASGGGAQDQQRKGLLFFSRLAGAGRHTSESSSSGMRKSTGGVYKTGGFES